MFIYLASPYSHVNPKVRHARYLAVQQTVVECLRYRIWVFSPIVHCHELKLKYLLPPEFSFWMEYDLSILSEAGQLNVLELPGWKESLGIQEEIRFAKMHHIPVYHIAPSEEALKELDYAK